MKSAAAGTARFWLGWLGLFCDAFWTQQEQRALLVTVGGTSRVSRPPDSSTCQEWKLVPFLLHQMGYKGGVGDNQEAVEDYLLRNLQAHHQRTWLLECPAFFHAVQMNCEIPEPYRAIIHELLKVCADPVWPVAPDIEDRFLYKGLIRYYTHARPARVLRFISAYGARRLSGLCLIGDRYFFKTEPLDSDEFEDTMSGLQWKELIVDLALHPNEYIGEAPPLEWLRFSYASDLGLRALESETFATGGPDGSMRYRWLYSRDDALDEFQLMSTLLWAEREWARLPSLHSRHGEWEWDCPRGRDACMHAWETSPELLSHLAFATNCVVLITPLRTGSPARLARLVLLRAANRPVHMQDGGEQVLNAGNGWSFTFPIGFWNPALPFMLSGRIYKNRNRYCLTRAGTSDQEVPGFAADLTDPEEAAYRVTRLAVFEGKRSRVVDVQVSLHGCELRVSVLDGDLEALDWLRPLLLRFVHTEGCADITQYRDSVRLRFASRDGAVCAASALVYDHLPPLVTADYLASRHVVAFRTKVKESKLGKRNYEEESSQTVPVKRSR